MQRIFFELKSLHDPAMQRTGGKSPIGNTGAVQFCNIDTNSSLILFLRMFNTCMRLISLEDLDISQIAFSSPHLPDFPCLIWIPNIYSYFVHYNGNDNILNFMFQLFWNGASFRLGHKVWTIRQYLSSLNNWFFNINLWPPAVRRLSKLQIEELDIICETPYDLIVIVMFLSVLWDISLAVPD